MPVGMGRVQGQEAVKRVGLSCCQGQVDRNKWWEGRARYRMASLGSGRCRSRAEGHVLRCPASTHCSPGSLEATPHAYLLLGLKVAQGTGKGSSAPTETSGQKQVLAL